MSYILNPNNQAREIAFAVFRVAKLVEQPKLKAALESAAVDLVAECGTIPYLSYVPQGVHLPYLPYIEKLSELIRLAEMVGEIKPVNSSVLQRELGNLYSAIAESIGKKEEINLEAEFRRENNASSTQAKAGIHMDPRVKPEDDKGAYDDNKETYDGNKEPQFRMPRAIEEAIIHHNLIPNAEYKIQDTKHQILEFDDQSTRQSAIMEFIRQLPNGCRMKDLTAKFPSVSERTLRNDLQILAAEGKIERFGAVQGPFSYFRAKVSDEGIATRV
jgi:hypothetical protein